jgi:meiotically up-regulated gene 157 (Mug157) protein
MKNFVVIVLILFLSVSCKKELVQEPKGLIEREKMIDIMYDLSLLEAMKYQNPLSLDSIDTNPKKFILRKYKVDSLQFAQSNIYYAADYTTYKDMFDQIAKRLEKKQKAVDSIVKVEEKKAAAKAKAAKKKAVAKDTLIKRPLRKVNVDSIRRARQLHK